MIFDPEVRDYVMYFFLQDLRQFHFNYGQEYGAPLDGVCQRIRSVLKGRFWTDSALNKFNVNLEMMQSIANELQNYKLVEDFVEKKTAGKVFKKRIEMRYFKITAKGLEQSRKTQVPPNPLPNLSVKNK